MAVELKEWSKVLADFRFDPTLEPAQFPNNHLAVSIRCKMGIEPTNHFEDTWAIVVVLRPVREFEHVGSPPTVEAYARIRLMSHLANTIEIRKLAVFVDRRQSDVEVLSSGPKGWSCIGLGQRPRNGPEKSPESPNGAALTGIFDEGRPVGTQ